MKPIHLAFLLISLLSLFSGCTLFESEYKKTDHVGPQSQVFYSTYENVWRATQLALSNYNIRINNMESGWLETEKVRSPYLWKTPWQNEQRYSGGYSYILKIRVVRGTAGRSNATKVSVEKLISLRRNFVDSARQLPSDGFEEKELLYRIRRELIIESAIERALKEKG